MNISVEYKDVTGIITNQVHKLTRLGFAKHFAFAGQGYAPRPQKLMRMIAMFLHYSYYLQRQAFNNDRFSEPPRKLSDPTEKAQFSNLVGKAMADFLSKRIDRSLYTVNYEAAMRLRGIPLSQNGKAVKRPDLIAYTQNSMLSIEAKGYAGGAGKMAAHKTQSLTGGIPVNFTIACVSYNLYKNVKCKYHDPFDDEIAYDNQTLSSLTRNYYKGLSEFLNQKYFDYREFEFQGESFYEVGLYYRYFEKVFSDEFPFGPIRHFEILDFYRPKLILPKRIMEFAENGITNEIEPFLFEGNEQDNYMYIDNDRVGLQIRR